MATKYGVLGQAAPAAGVLTDIYLVPVQKFADRVRIISCNRGGSVSSVRVALAPNGAANSNVHDISTDKPIEPYDTVSTVEVTLGEGSIVRVASDTGDVTFNVIGVESTVR
jgi:hypothetical protein